MQEDVSKVAVELADTLYGVERLVVESLTQTPMIKDVILAHLIVIYHHLDEQPESLQEELVATFVKGFSEYATKHKGQLGKNRVK